MCKEDYRGNRGAVAAGQCLYRKTMNGRCWCQYIFYLTSTARVAKKWISYQNLKMTKIPLNQVPQIVPEEGKYIVLLWFVQNHPCKMRENFMSRARSLSFQQYSSERAFIFVFSLRVSGAALLKKGWIKLSPQLDHTPDSCFCLRTGDTRRVPLTCVSSTSKARTSSAVCFLFQFLRCS